MSMAAYDKHAAASIPEAPCTYIHTYTACLRVSPLYCRLNESVQCALLESHFLAQRGGGGGWMQNPRDPATNNP